MGLSSTQLWLVLGFSAQALFSARSDASHCTRKRAGKSVMPVTFWYFSIAGAVLLLAYALHRRDPVFSLGQGAGLAVYLRNLYLIRRQAKRNPPPEQPLP